MWNIHGKNNCATIYIYMLVALLYMFCCNCLMFAFVSRLGTWFLIFWSWYMTAVMATMPGYKSRSTFIWLEEAAMTLDFVLDPEVTHKGSLLRSGCECDCGNKSRLQFVGFLWGGHLEVCFILIVVVGFLCFLFQRRMKSNFSKHRQVVVPKRPVGVWR